MQVIVFVAVSLVSGNFHLVLHLQSSSKKNNKKKSIPLKNVVIAKEEKREKYLMANAVDDEESERESYAKTLKLKALIKRHR